MNPSTPVMPLEGSGTDSHWMQEDAHLARLLGGGAIPLTLLAQRAGATTANAGRLDHAQAAIGALFAAHGGEAAALLSTGASHRVGEESLSQRSGQLSEAGGSGGWTIPGGGSG